jgi:hypothetical protein
MLANSMVEQGTEFSGFLINPVDGFSYLAKMRQGSSGGWMFHLPYTSEPGEGVFIFTFYIFMGKLADLLGWAPQFVYHVIRTITAGGMFFVAYLLVTEFIPSPKLRWRAYLLILFGSGFGWLGTLFGMIASDLNIPESIPLYSAFANAHFPLATLLFLAIIIITLREKEVDWQRFLVIFLLSTLLALVQPFVFIVIGTVLGFWQIWEIRVRMRESGHSFLDSFKALPWASFSGIVLGAIPWLIYDYTLTINHEAISAWNQQNLTPSPPPIEFIFGLGGVFLLAVIGLRRVGELTGPSERLLIVWVVIQPLLLYAPFSLQRRLSMGLYFAVVILAIIALGKYVRPKRFNLVFALLFAFSLPSNLLVMGSGLAELNAAGGELVLGVDELASYQWLESATEQNALVLANSKIGNRIPAFTGHRVLYGHPFETPNAEQQEDLINRLLSSERNPDAVLEELNRLGVRYVLISDWDRGEGDLEWLDEIDQIFDEGEYAIYEMPK